MLSKREIKFVGAEQGSLSQKWLLKFELYRDSVPGGMIRTSPQYDNEEAAIEAAKKIEQEYNTKGILPNLFKLF
jgi:hypothetical protein